MAVTSRQDLKEYALRNLGAPVIEINVDEDQLEDRIDEALEFWRLYHHEGVEKFYLKHQIKASTLTLVESIADTFDINQTIRGETSGAEVALIHNKDTDPQAYAEYQAFRTQAKALADGWVNK